MASTFRFDFATARISTVELPTSRFVVCSRPYPIEISEAVSLGAALTSGNLGTSLYTMAPENITPAAALTGGELRQLLLTYANWAAENMTPAASLDSGELRQLLRSYVDWPAENMTPGATLDSGELKVALIQYAARGRHQGLGISQSAHACSIARRCGR